MKSSNYKTTIFSMALAMFQAGRAKSSVYCSERDIFLLNFDKTLLLKFELPAEEKPFEREVGFVASDYEEGDFYEDGDEIVFVSGDDNFRKEKRCKTPGKKPSDIRSLFDSYFEGFDSDNWSSAVLSEKNLALLKSDLSHVEIVAENCDLSIIQRDIYAGAKTILKRESGPLNISEDNLKYDFGPIGWRTPDIFALFFICPVIRFYFPPDMVENRNFYCIINGADKSRGVNVSGILSGCIYDELGVIGSSTEEKKKEEVNGREKQKNRRRQQGSNSEVDGGAEEEGNTEPRARRRSRSEKPGSTEEKSGVVWE